MKQNINKFSTKRNGMQNNTVSDELLVQKALSGDLTSFEIIVKRYRQKIYRHTMKILKDNDMADDATQDTFIRVYENLDKFDIERRLSPWIYKISTNICYDMIRKEKKKVELAWEVPDDKEGLLEKVIRRDRISTIVKLVKRLPGKYRKPLVSYYFEDTSYKNLAKQYSLPENTIKTRLRRAKMQLAEIATEENI